MAIFKTSSTRRLEKEAAELRDYVKKMEKAAIFESAANSRGRALNTIGSNSPNSPYYEGQAAEGQFPISPYQTTPRPVSRISPLQTAGIQYPASPVNLFDLYNAAQASDILTAVFNVLKRDVFRRGIKWLPAFAAKCVPCDIAYEEPVESCESCGGTQLTKPDPKQKKKFERFLHVANENGQPLSSVLREMEDDLNTVDGAYMIIRKTYITGKPSDNAFNGIYWSEVRELIRGDPLRMRILGNTRARIGNKYWCCIRHRTREEDKNPNLTMNEDTSQYVTENTLTVAILQNKMGFCDQSVIYEEEGVQKERQCGEPLHEVFYASTDGGLRIMEPYVEGEVIHLKRFSPGLLYGKPILIGLWKDTTTRLRMKQYLNEFFRFFRYPRGVLAVVTDNPEGFYRFWDSQLDRLRYDPWHIPALAVEKRDGKGSFDFIKFTGTFEELQYAENMEETKASILRAFGVVEVTADEQEAISGPFLKPLPSTVEYHQATYEEHLFPRLMSQFSITDWKLEILPEKEEDELKALEVRLKKIEEAERMLNMGYTVTRNLVGNFQFSGQATPLDMQGAGGAGEATGEESMSEIDALLSDMIGGESDKNKAQEGGVGPADKQEGGPQPGSKGGGSKPM